jgi:DNA gyrase subunit A
MPVNISDELMLITSNGKLIRCKLESVRITGRNTSGVILFKTEQEEKVVSVALIAENPETEEENMQDDSNDGEVLPE